MNLMKTKSKASIKGTPKGEKKKLENVFIIPAELRQQILIAFAELPRKYGQLLNPLEEALVQAINLPEIELMITPTPEPPVKKLQPKLEPVLKKEDEE